MKTVGIDSQKISLCVGQKSEEWLSEELRNVAWSPQALRLNGWRYSGPLDPEMVLKAVCSGYERRPVECGELIEGIHRANVAVTWVSVSGALWMLSLLVVVLLVAFYIYRWHVAKSVRTILREEVMLEVQTQMSDYTAMQDRDKGEEHR